MNSGTRLIAEPFTVRLRHSVIGLPQRRPGKIAVQCEIVVTISRNTSFEVKQGEVLGIIPRNGAGKSTLLKILSRITDPTEGHAQIRGRVNSLLEVGAGFHQELTGREKVYMLACGTARERPSTSKQKS